MVNISTYYSYLLMNVVDIPCHAMYFGDEECDDVNSDEEYEYSDDYNEHKNGTYDDDEYDGVDSGNDPPTINYADPTYCDLATL